MPRPRCRRRIEGAPGARVFKPAGRPAAALESVALSLEEYEAVRLADFLGLYQEAAAGRMDVSRQTFGRMLTAARRKIACALVRGLALRIDAAGGAANAVAANAVALETASTETDARNAAEGEIAASAVPEGAIPMPAASRDEVPAGGIAADDDVMAASHGRRRPGRRRGRSRSSQ